jgi:hypothetical protein
MDNLVEYYSTKYRNIVRGVLDKVKTAQRLRSEDAINNALAYFDHHGDLGLIASKFKARYAKQIKTEGGETSTGVSTPIRTYYTKEDVVRAIDEGMYEIFSTGIGTQICKALACITDQPDQYFEYLKKADQGSTDAQNIEDVSTLIDAVRTGGGFSKAMSAVDMASVICDDAWLHVYYKGWRICYDVVTPADIWFLYGTQVTEWSPDGTQFLERAVDYSDIDDASVVIIRLANQADQGDGLASDRTQYLAYIGECGPYPLGRMVTYWKTGTEPWPLPEKKEDYFDYRRNERGGSGDTGTPCNPLTWLKKNGDEAGKVVGSEYPLIKWVGGNGTVGKGTKSGEISLLETSLEIDLAVSNCVRYAMMGARGKNVFEFAGAAVRLPTSLDDIVMPEGTYRVDGRSSSEAQGASEVLKWVVATVASGYNVPDYQVLRDSAIPESGIALAIKTLPFLAHRARRIGLNEASMGHIFDTERALLIATDGGQAESILQPDITQMWHPGTWQMPEDEGTRIDTLIKLRNSEAIDHIAFLARVHHITEAEALKLDEKMKGRADVGGYGTPAPAPEPQQQPGQEKTAEKEFGFE